MGRFTFILGSFLGDQRTSFYLFILSFPYLFSILSGMFRIITWRELLPRIQRILTRGRWSKMDAE